MYNIYIQILSKRGSNSVLYPNPTKSKIDKFDEN